MDKKFDSYFEGIQFLEGLANIPQQKDYMSDRTHPEVYLRRMRYFFELIPDIRRTVLRASGGRSSHFQFIHVAGTAGKGSVTTMLHEVLRAAGKRVGSFTSPFMTTSIEKIRVGDTYIAPKELVEIVAELKPHITKAYMESPYGGPSYFEIWFAIAIKYFLRKKCDFVVLEVGLGGKYDPGVLITGCVATVLTNVDFDHTHLLGRTLAKIGREKAGIMKRGVPFFTTEQRPHLLKMFKDMASSKGVRVVQVKDWIYGGSASGQPEAEPRHITPQLGMDYKGMNAALVWEIAKHLQIPEQAIIKGIGVARLPCRFELIQQQPPVVLDGAHSVAKIRSTVANLQRLKFLKLILVIGITASKDVQGMCKLIVPKADYVIVTRHQMPFRKSAHIKDVMQHAGRFKKTPGKVEAYIDPEQALDRAFQLSRPYDAILVTGSFFLAGKLRERWYSEEKILKTRKSF